MGQQEPLTTPDAQMTDTYMSVSCGSKMYDEHMTKSKFSHISSYIRNSLHWLPIRQRIQDLLSCEKLSLLNNTSRPTVYLSFFYTYLFHPLGFGSGELGCPSNLVVPLWLSLEQCSPTGCPHAARRLISCGPPVLAKFVRNNISLFVKNQVKDKT